MRFSGLLGLAGILALPFGLEVAGPLNAPPRAGVNSGAVITTDRKGEERWRAEWGVEPVVRSGEAMIRFLEQGQGRYSPYREPIRWELEAYWTVDPYAPFSYEKRIFRLDGSLRTTERRQFDWDRGTVHFERIDGGGKRTFERVLSVPRDTLTAEGLAVALQQLPFDKPRPVKAHFLSDEPKLYRVTFQIGRQETVETPAGAIPSFQVDMGFDLGFLNLLKPFIPETRLWFSVAPPHFWVQYRGLENGRGSPVVKRVMLK